jgi:pimeloyl-ACP methyl ester carboxylesterase
MQRTMARLLPGLDQRWDEIDGIRTFSRHAGSGEDVVLIHGLGVSSDYWLPAMRYLAATGLFRVHAPDLPGFGRSAPPPWDIGVRTMAAHLRLWVETVIPGPIHLVGQSLGCELAVLGAMWMPERVRKLVLTAPNGMPDPRPVMPQLLGAAADAFREPPSLYRVILPDYLRCGPGRLLRLLIAQRDDPTEELLSGVTQPALVVRGERDAVVDRDRAISIAERLPHGQWTEIPGAHGAHFTEPAAFSEVVTRFLRPLAVRSPRS